MARFDTIDSMEKQVLIIEIEASEESIAKLLGEFEKREDDGEFEINAVTIRKD